MGKNKTIRFNNRADRSFFTDVSKRTQAYFKETGQSGFINAKWWLKVVMIAVIIISSYTIMMTFGNGRPWVYICTIIPFTFGGLLLGFNIAHDASHNALFRNKKYNYIFLRAFDLFGMSGYLWTLKHVRSHHKYTNIIGLDADIGQMKLIRLSPLTPILSHHRFQGLYAPLLYANFTIFLIYIKDFIMILSSEIGDQREIKHPWHEVLILIGSKVYYTFIAVGIPMLVLDIAPGTILLGFWVAHMVTSTFAMMILLPVHLVDDTVFPMPDEEENMIKNNWSVHQLDCTSDFAVNSSVVSWMAGGLNQHLAHHLCPTICHIHYGPLTKIIQEVAKEHKLDYKANSWMGAIASHWRFLYKMGRIDNPYQERLPQTKVA